MTHHQVESAEELRTLKELKHLFLFNNRIKSLSGVEGLTQLEHLYVQFNEIPSLEPVRGLLQLRELYVHDNRITSLEGLTETHADMLQSFYCKPNEQLKEKELLRVERELGIRCGRI